MSHGEQRSGHLVYPWQAGRKVDSLLNISKVQQHTLTEHDERLRALEHYKSYAIGVTIAVGAIVSYLTQFLT